MAMVKTFRLENRNKRCSVESKLHEAMNEQYSSFIAEHGYAIVPDVFRGEEMTSLVEQFCRADIVRTRAGVRHALKYPEVVRLAEDPRLANLASSTLGGSAFPYRATLFDKSPASNWLVVWHQDTMLPVREKRDVPDWGPWSIKDGVIFARAPPVCSPR
ncbi:MAG: hypothetical protein JWO91_3226 [Acidobacteriaceae bacterium]|nr:hypothetical protein [Acidobacteriaceae bacterium]